MGVFFSPHPARTPELPDGRMREGSGVDDARAFQLARVTPDTGVFGCGRTEGKKK